MEYEFTLKFKLAEADASAESLVEQLGAGGCDDALVGVGQPGRIALDFTRDAKSASEAVLSAIKDVRRALPDAQLIEASPDYVGLTDVAEMVGVSRQNMRKLMATHLDFPSPIHAGSSQIWHLDSVLRWLSGRIGSHRIEPGLLEIAQVTMQVNLTKEAKRLEPAQQERFRKWVAA
jgi:predicted DNA-binding transcriptional regulator AlpA